MNTRIAPFQTLSLRAGALSRRGVGAVPEPDGDAVDIRALMRTFWQNRWRVLAAMALAGLVTLIAVSLMTPTYRAYSKVMLDPRKAQIITNAEVVSDLNPSEQVVNGEIAVLRSNILMQRVIEAVDPSVLEKIDPALQPESLMSRAKGWLGLLRGTVGGAGGDGAETAVLTPEQQRIERLVSAIRARVKIYTEPSSYVMVIRVESRYPVVAMALANTIANSYISQQIENRRAAVGRATGWLEDRLRTLRAQVEAAEAAVAEFQAKSLIANGGTLDTASQQLADLNRQLIDARAARVEAEARLEQLRSVVEQQGLEAAAQIVDTPALAALRAQALDLRQKDAVWARSFDEGQDRRVEIRKKLDEITAAMTAQVGNVQAMRRSDLEIARIRENGLTQSISDMENRVVQISQSRLGLRQLEREAAAARVNYESLLTRITEARTQRQLQQSDVKLIERAALPVKPSAPKTRLLTVLGVVVGGTLMVLWVFFSEMTAVTFRSAGEVEAETGLPVLVSLPKEKWRDTRSALADIRRDPYGRYAERIRQLRTTLLMRKSTTGGGQSVMVMSSAPGEGKTTATLALAEMAALAGKAAIVVDCDLRRPRVQQAVDLQMTRDFADFIEGNSELPDIIYTSVGNGFDVIGARAPRQSAADQLSIQWLEPFLGELTRVYDLVIIDAPAMLAVSDAMIVAEAVDTRLYLVAGSETPRAAVKAGLARLSEMNLGVMGVILNKVDARTGPDPYAEGYSYDA